MSGLLAIPAALMLAASGVQGGAPQGGDPAVAPPAATATDAPAPDAPPPASPAHPVSPPAPPLGTEGDIVVSARHPTKEDPLAGLNAKSYEAIQAVDTALVGPVAKGYETGVPRPIRSGMRNFLRNLEEPVSAVNYLLQLKPGRAVKSLGRFAVNTSFGVAGLVDVAKTRPFNLPYKPNGFANTFACWGIGNGPYFFVPLAGPITLRDLVGLLMDKAAVPFAAGKPFSKPYYAIPAGVVDALNDRIEQDSLIQRLREESPDPYVATRDLYLKQRRAEVGSICPRHGDAKPDPNLPPRVGKGAD